MKQAAHDSVLSLHNLEIGYVKRNVRNSVLSNLNASLVRGEMVCLVGHNGIGKSTLIRSVCGLQPILSGKVSILGKELEEYPKTELARLISLVLTDRIAVGNLSVYDLVALGRHPYTDWYGRLSNEDIGIIENCIKLARIGYLRDRMVNELSDGQLQKVLIARALAQDGEIMILDEPTAHLDLNNKISVMKLLHELAEKTDKAILIATHELEVSIHIADKLWIVGGEKPLISGTPEDLILNGEFDILLFEEGLKFDKLTGKFGIEKNYQGKISISGPDELVFWTANALHRRGYEAVSKPQAMHIDIEQVNDKTTWILQANDARNVFDSIDKLLLFLKNGNA